MIYPYKVKHNGIVYPAGAEVPVGIQATKEEKKPEPKEEAKAEIKAEKKEEAEKPVIKNRPRKTK